MALVASLALYLMGSNYCLLSAWGGNTGMACMTTPGDGSTSAVPACHHAAPVGKSPAGRPVAKRSCCPAPVVAANAPTLAKAEAVPASPAEAVPVAVATLAPPMATDRHGRRAAPDGQPPTRLARAPVPARAPPLA